MGTVFSIDVPADVPDRVLDDAVDWLRWVDETFSTYRPGSAVSRLGRGEVRVEACPPEVGEVLDLCTRLRRETDGYFDATAGGRLDPSGLVKGWAVERASARLRATGAPSHCLNGGGDVCLAAEPGTGRRWRVGIVDPLSRHRLVAVVSGADVGVATSGTAERGGHVRDPFTGRPATTLASVTVVGPSLARADAYATAAVAMQERASRWLPTLTDYAALVQTAAGDRWHTANWPALTGEPT
jgi:thiamine biosynthesis lipoprotein